MDTEPKSKPTPVFTPADVSFYAATQKGQRVTADAVRKAVRAHRLVPSVVSVGGISLFTQSVVEAWLSSRQERRRGRGSGRTG